jgi:aspartyl-tRNA(Asn)/glutamyl-tRNA(Gln) amidotransferase subunit B
VLRELIKRPEQPEKLLRELGLERLTRKELLATIEKAIAANPKAVQDYLAGKREALNFLAGKVMQLAKGRADPREIVKLLRSRMKKVT